MILQFQNIMSKYLFLLKKENSNEIKLMLTPLGKTIYNAPEL